MVPDNTPVYIAGEQGELGITTVQLETDDESNYKKFIVRLDYLVD